MKLNRRNYKNSELHFVLFSRLKISQWAPATISLWNSLTPEVTEHFKHRFLFHSLMICDKKDVLLYIHNRYRLIFPFLSLIHIFQFFTVERTRPILLEAHSFSSFIYKHIQDLFYPESILKSQQLKECLTLVKDVTWNDQQGFFCGSVTTCLLTGSNRSTEALQAMGYSFGVSYLAAILLLQTEQSAHS